jgi:hypothetical protein
MLIAPACGAAGRDGARPRTVVCTKDGVWLWPATPLTERRGGVLAPLPTLELYRLVASLHGPGVHIPVLERAIARAAAFLDDGRVTAADELVAELELPPISYGGAALMKALGRRLGIARPVLRDRRPVHSVAASALRRYRANPRSGARSGPVAATPVRC